MTTVNYQIGMEALSTGGNIPSVVGCKNDFFEPKTRYEFEINIEHEDATDERILLPAATNSACQLKMMIRYRNQKLRTKFEAKGQAKRLIFEQLEIYLQQHYPTLNLSVDHIRIVD